jgi:hypothetical protein
MNAAMTGATRHTRRIALPGLDGLAIDVVIDAGPDAHVVFHVPGGHLSVDAHARLVEALFSDALLRHRRRMLVTLHSAIPPR